MPLIFEQPNLDDPSTNHLYFDCGDGRTITVFTREDLKPSNEFNENRPGSVHHIAFWVSQSTIRIAKQNLNENGFQNSGIKDRGFIREGYKADLVLINPTAPWTVNKENIGYKCGWSPFEGTTFKSRVTHTFVNGVLVFSNGKYNEEKVSERLTFNR